MVQAVCLSTLGMVRQEYTNKKRRGVVRKFRGAARLVKHFSAYMAFLRVMTRPQLIELTRRHPGILSKCLRSDYLARSFRTRSRLSILTNHYGYLAARVNKDFLRRVYSEGYLLWQERMHGHALGIELAFPKEYDYEGDLCLVFRCDAVAIYAITFTLIPGRVIQLDAGQALLVSNVQGASGQIDLMRQATKCCHDTAPVHLLLCAAQAIALCLDIHKIVGIGREEQVALAFGGSDEAAFVFDYDRFWRSYASEILDGRYYVMHVPFTEKPLSDIRPKHRSRGLRRRELRKQIAEQVRSAFVQRCLAHQ